MQDIKTIDSSISALFHAARAVWSGLFFTIEFAILKTTLIFMKIFLDDLYETERKSWIPDGYVGVKNFEEFKKLLEDALERGDKIEGLSFDNDLGAGEIDGWEVAKWLMETHPEIFADNPELTAHSSNPDGREVVAYYLNRGLKKYKELIEAKNRPNPWGSIEGGGR